MKPSIAAALLLSALCATTQSAAQPADAGDTDAAATFFLSINADRVDATSPATVTVVRDAPCADMAFRVSRVKVEDVDAQWQKHESGRIFKNAIVVGAEIGKGRVSAVCADDPDNPQWSNSETVIVTSVATVRVFVQIEGTTTTTPTGAVTANLTATLSRPAAFTWMFGDGKQLDVTPEQLARNEEAWVHHAVRRYEGDLPTVRIQPRGWSPTAGSVLQAPLQRPDEVTAQTEAAKNTDEADTPIPAPSSTFPIVVVPGLVLLVGTGAAVLLAFKLRKGR